MTKIFKLFIKFLLWYYERDLTRKMIEMHVREMRNLYERGRR